VSVIDTASRSVKHTLEFEIRRHAQERHQPGRHADHAGWEKPPGSPWAAPTMWPKWMWPRTPCAKSYLAGKTRHGAWASADDGSRLYVVNGLSDDLTIVDVAQRQADQNRSPLGRVPHSVLTN
jgi:hypothetical protein